ncbi:DUF541 domain-containing protein [Roseibium denhamense]|uniref:DUF541 domain-containing protein n=1 Tax=Roseibium denhamense TaxID=76305 RepID=A0ABY1NDH3_9HYPH|nr:SIMPL domain-containing protein [Roseibium denhamense]MTI04312.1 DUF541 domain-containing protein [Roseibium denhamense]SMP07087.1 hypothetical protein SAMN06265374_0831 [Roseibium denhamense]
MNALLPYSSFKTLRQSAAAVGAAALIIVSVLPSHTVLADEKVAPVNAVITMDGRGTVSVAPDMAVITTNVVTTGKTATDALAANTRDIGAVIEAIKGKGVEAKDIQTRGFAIYPRYERITDNSNRQPNIIGYEVRNGVEVNVRDLASLGDLLTLVVESGANSVDGIRFEVSDPQEKLDEARKRAVEEAKRKAAIFSEAAGVRLGAILAISETGTHMPSPLRMKAEGLMMASAAPVPIEAGEETISASVTIRWALEQPQ